MVSVLNSRSSGPGLRPGPGNCVVLLGKTLCSDSAFLIPSVSLGSDEFNAGCNPEMDKHPIQVGVEILLVT